MGRPRAKAERDPVAQLQVALSRHAGDWRSLVVAFSGGPDSTALLAAVTRIAPVSRVHALHVDHGWHAESGSWADYCRQQARALGSRCTVERAEPAPGTGEGAEAAARRARYQILERHVSARDVLLTAHHLEDQAETLLLALFRGGGVHGWASMPPVSHFGNGGVHLRPWLQLPRAVIAAWREREWPDLQPLEDPANQDPRFERVWLRQSVLPTLRARWPQIDATLARSASQAAAAAAGVDTLAAKDFVRCRGRLGDTVDCATLASLPEPRQRGLLRWWIARNGLPRPPAARLESLLAQLLGARADRNPCVAWPGAEVRRWRGEAWALRPVTPPPTGVEYCWDDPRQPLVLPDRVLTPGVLERLGVEVPPGASVRVRYRRGGERIQLTDSPRARALKTLLTDRGVPPWERDRTPLVYVDGSLVAVVGLGRAVEHA